ncbi:MAG: ABC transporter ATP-binding protein [bacterium]
MQSLVVVRNVHKTYVTSGKRLEVLSDINIEVKKGQTLAIIGPSGAGKSTLLHILGALDKPTSGEVVFEGTDTGTLGDEKLSYLRNQRIGFVFQFHHLLPEFTAIENVSIPGYMHQKKRDEVEIQERARELLEAVGLKERMAHRPPELSGGEQQRVAVARALVNSPDIVLADEPTGNLDGVNSDIVYNLLLDLTRKNNQALVVVTHNSELAQKMSKVVQIIDGKIV